MTHNETAYQNAINRKIRENSYKGSLAWRKENAELIEKIKNEATGTYPNKFIVSMFNNIQEWGKLTDNQLATAKKVLDCIEKRAEEREEQYKIAAENSASGYVGVEKKRYSFTLDIKKVFQQCGYNDFYFIHLMIDRNDNEYVYMGNKKLGEDGERIKINATIKEHGEYRGIKQNRLSRPYHLKS